MYLRIIKNRTKSPSALYVYCKLTEPMRWALIPTEQAHSFGLSFSGRPNTKNRHTHTLIYTHDTTQNTEHTYKYILLNWNYIICKHAFGFIEILLTSYYYAHRA